MLDSMASNPRPTRPEVSDVANAILDVTDAVMLSNETAVDQFTVESMATMAKIAERIEKEILEDACNHKVVDVKHPIPNSVCGHLLLAVTPHVSVARQL